MTVLELIKDGQIAEFIRFENFPDKPGKVPTLWYKTSNLEFPIPLNETEGAEFLAQMPASILKRWIRKHLEFLKG
jgi:hypothetical protein